MVACPHCGRQIELVAKQGLSLPYEGYAMKRYESTAPLPWAERGALYPDQVLEWERREPTRAPTWESDVRVPLGQSALCGVFVCLLTIPIVVLNEWHWWLSPFAGVLSSAVLWVVLLSQARSMLWKVERVLNRDIDGDGNVGPAEHRTVIEARIDDGRFVRDLVLYFDDVPPEKLHVLFQAALGGGSLAEGVWTGRGGPFSRSQFSTIRDRMIESGLWAWVDPDSHAQGVQVLSGGRSVMRHWCEQFARTHAHALDGYEFARESVHE